MDIFEKFFHIWNLWGPMHLSINVWSWSGKNSKSWYSLMLTEHSGTQYTLWTPPMADTHWHHMWTPPMDSTYRYHSWISHMNTTFGHYLWTPLLETINMKHKTRFTPIKVKFSKQFFETTSLYVHMHEQKVFQSN